MEKLKQEIEEMFGRHQVKIDGLTTGNVVHRKPDLRLHAKAMKELIIRMIDELPPIIRKI